MQFSCREYCSKKITSSQGKKHFLFSYQFNTFFPLFLVIGQLQSKQLEGGEYMELAQAVNTNDRGVFISAFGLTYAQLFWGLLAIVAIIFALWVLNRYANRTGEYGFRGTKGGKVKRTITEYEEDENEL